ncbi:hypothetical protein [Streptomyces finlayi]|nr:hypothetical protein [Streptomyces finlayi]
MRSAARARLADLMAERGTNGVLYLERTAPEDDDQADEPASVLDELSERVAAYNARRRTFGGLG